MPRRNRNKAHPKPPFSRNSLLEVINTRSGTYYKPSEWNKCFQDDPGAQAVLKELLGLLKQGKVNKVHLPKWSGVVYGVGEYSGEA